MNPLALPKLGTIVLILGTAFGAGAWLNGTRWESKYALLLNEYQQLKGGVAALGHEAEARNAKQALADIKSKERADEQNRRQHAADIDTITRLRRDADRARGSVVPAAPAGSSRPDLACFDRAELERGNGEALGRLREGARRVADKGTAAAVDLDTARAWATSP
jgi:hypothetical protein